MIRRKSHLITFLFLRKLRITSNASRNIKKLEISHNLSFYFPKLALTPISRAGRAHSGRIVCYTKTTLKIRSRVPRLNYLFQPLFLACAVNFFLTSYPLKVVSLVSTLDGGFTFLQLSSTQSLFGYLYTKTALPPLTKFLTNPTFSQLRLLVNTAKVSSLNAGFGDKAIYVRSPGVYATILQFNLLDHTVNLELPSGIQKTFSVYALATLGPVAFIEKALMSNTKSGFWRTRGHKSQVRGVAKNPVDHPHGGRTKSIRYPRTPWGKTTKFK